MLKTWQFSSVMYTAHSDFVYFKVHKKKKRNKIIMDLPQIVYYLSLNIFSLLSFYGRIFQKYIKYTVFYLFLKAICQAIESKKRGQDEFITNEFNDISLLRNRLYTCHLIN